MRVEVSGRSGLNDFERIEERRSSRQSRANRPVECRQNAAVACREREEITVRHLIVALHVRKGRSKQRVGGGQIIGPEDVVLVRDESDQLGRGPRHGEFAMRNRRRCENANTADLCDRASSPTSRPRSGEPGASRAVVDVPVPEVSHQEIDVRKSNAVNHGKSASSVATSASVSKGKSSGTSMIGNPSSPIPVRILLIPRLAMVEIATPRGTRFASAKHRAASSTSSSIESVVRMVVLYRMMRLPVAESHTTTRSGV